MVIKSHFKIIACLFITLFFCISVIQVKGEVQERLEESKESPFSGPIDLELQNQIDILVTNIKKEMGDNPKLEKKIENLLIEVTTGHSRFLEVEGKQKEISNIAWEKLREIGKPTIPFLVDVLSNKDIQARRDALWILSGVILEEKQGGRMARYTSFAKDCIPIYIRSLKDIDENVRSRAIASLGNMARFNVDVRELVIPHLTEMLNDKSQDLRHMTAEYLLHLGREDLIPDEILPYVGKEQW